MELTNHADLSVAGSPAVLEGNLACLSAFELFQTLHYLRKCGSIVFESDGKDGEQLEATCSLAVEGLVDARCGHLHDRQALLAIVWWKRGRFVFESLPQLSVADAIPLQGILMDAVRLADEIEARDDLLPDDRAPLEIGTRGSFVDFDDVDAAAEITELLATRSISRRELVQRLPFAPVTIGFAIARLLEEGMVRPAVASDALIRMDRPAVESVTGAPAPSLLRWVIAFVPPTHEVALALISQLNRSLGRESASSFLDPSGISFFRLRPPNGQLVSVTALPITQRNRFVFESLLPSLHLAVFLGDERPSLELDEWSRLASQTTPAINGSDWRLVYDQILEEMAPEESGTVSETVALAPPQSLGEW